MPSKKEIETIIKGAWGLPPQKAIDFLESKGLKVSVDWTDVWKEAHARAFTVAGITRLDLLKDVHESLVDAQKRGVPFEEFKKGFKDILRKKGWLGNQTVTRKDGSEKVVDVSTPRRIKTIFNTNMSSAAMAGMYGELKSMSDEMPYWRYVTVGDGNVRESHARLHGLVLRADDPFWDKYFPPNGFNCRCRVDALTEDEVRENGYKVGDGDTAKYAAMPVVNPGWDYNPGKAVYLPRPEDYPEGMRAEVREFVEEAKEKFSELEYEKLVEKEYLEEKRDRDGSFGKARTIKEANEHAKNELKITNADYGELDVGIANKTNQALKIALDKYPALGEKLQFVGEVSRHSEIIRRAVEKYHYNNMKANYGSKYDSSSIAMCLEQIEQEMKKYEIPEDSIAMTIRVPVKGQIYTQGISINKNNADNLKEFLVNQNYLMKKGEFPEGCDSVKSAIDHEIGHLLDSMLNLRDIQRIKDIFNVEQKELPQKLSSYASESINEMIAEAWSEFCNNPKPRALAKEIGNLILKTYEEKYGKTKR